MIRILLVDDHPAMREGLTATFGADPELKVVGEAESAQEALEVLARRDADVAVVDLLLPGVSGLDLCARLAGSKPALRILALTGYADDRAMLDAFAAGAHGFVVKGSTPPLIREAVKSVARGETFVDPKVGDRLVAIATRGQEPRGRFGLTRKEAEVLRLFPTGLSYRAIADRLGVSRETVRTHARSILQKLGAKDKVEAAAMALREGLAPPQGRSARNT